MSGLCKTTAGYRLFLRRKIWGLRCIQKMEGELLVWNVCVSVCVKSLLYQDGAEHNCLYFQLREYYVELLVSGHCVAMK